MTFSRHATVSSSAIAPCGQRKERFGAITPLAPDPQRTNLSEFTASDLSHINRELQRYRYGKPLGELLQPSNRFRVYPHHPYVVLQNFQFLPQPPAAADKPKTLWGICHELALQLAQRIANRQVNISHPRDLGIEVVTGQSARYFNYPTATHVFLMAFREKHRRTIERQLNEPGREIPHRTFEDTLDSPKCIIPDHAIVIDPSYGVTQGHADHDRYRIFRIFPMENLVKAAKGIRFNVMSLFSLHDEGGPSTGQVPLGYLKDLMPKSTEGSMTDPLEFPPEALLHLGFVEPKPTSQNDKPPIKAELYLQQGPNERPKWWKGWESRVPKESPLRQMMDQIQADLLKPEPAFCEQLNRRYPFEMNNVFNIPSKLLGWA